MPDTVFVVSCEHGGNRIPAAYRSRFDSDVGRAALESHRGWDPGSLEIARRLAGVLGAPLAVQRVSRLLVECNRSLGHRALWSEISRGLGDADKAAVLDRYWHAHRDAVRALVAAVPEGARVVHVGVHTFTPVWKGRTRGTDVGLLYDPRRPAERRLAVRWQRTLARELRPDGLRVHRNRPYRGWTDGLTTSLRAELPSERYMGLELEVSQRIAPLGVEAVVRIGAALRAALA